MAPRLSDEYRSGRWATDLATHQLIDCDPGAHDRGDRFLCPSCTNLLSLLVADLPALIADLDLALTRQVRFVSHGSFRSENVGGTAENSSENVSENVAENAPNVAGNVAGNVAKTSHRDESPLPFNPAVAKIRDALAYQLGTKPDTQLMTAAAHVLADWLDKATMRPDAAAWAWRLSRVAQSGFAVIDRPPDLSYHGQCDAGHDIWDEREADPIRCQACSYSAPLVEHRHRLLLAGDDAMLTVAELVEAITKGGERVTRHQITSWIRREGLAREKAQRRRFDNLGRLVVTEDWVYRLGDVRERLAGGDRRTGTA